MDTTHPEGTSYESDRASWERSIAQFSASTNFDDLEILGSESLEQSGQVTFRATLTQGDQDVSFTEHSRFLKLEGRWAYHSGEIR